MKITEEVNIRLILYVFIPENLTVDTNKSIRSFKILKNIMVRVSKTSTHRNCRQVLSKRREGGRKEDGKQGKEEREGEEKKDERKNREKG